MEVNAFRSLPALQHFLSDESIEIKRVLLDAASSEIYDPMSLETPGAMFYVFFEYKEDIVQNERVRLYDLIGHAREVSQDEEYLTLKNNRQREIYLLGLYSLTKPDAADVIELLKPEMATLFKEEEQ